MKLRPLLADKGGTSAIEFALLAPVLILFLIGIAQLGLVFFANAGLNNAIASGARHATLFPRPTEAEIRSRIDAARFGLDPAGVAAPKLTYNTTASPHFADIQMSYTMSLNFIVYQAPLTLTQTRRVYLQPLT
ncbi:MAG TPA: TadE/TadG family type IV pilus assembly protein [Allosphingosinicella sp.]|nr:TadE/TadG family type IV pilus assembly protein [Allosphingosinicella sp.]